TVHEVANGLLRAARPEVALAIFPVGSANDYAHSLHLGPEWWFRQNGNPSVSPVDAGIVRAPDGRERFFINGLGLGFNGAVNLEAKRLPRLQGLLLYSTALLKALCLSYRYPRMTVSLDGQARQVPTLALTLAIGRREGNFVVAPNAILDDGLFDYLHAADVPR